MTNLMKPEVISALIAWNEDNDNKIGLKNPDDKNELIRLIGGGLDPFEFISEEDIEPYMS